MSYNDDNEQNVSDTGRGEFPHATNFGPDPVRAEVEREFQAVRDSDGEPRTNDGDHPLHNHIILYGEQGDSEPVKDGVELYCPHCDRELDPQTHGGQQYAVCPTGKYEYSGFSSASYSLPHGELRTDGGVSDEAELPTGDDLTGFQWDTLRILIEDERYGLAIKSALEARYDAEITHARLYINLNALIDEGLVEKSQLDGRTNIYTATDRARRAFCSRLRWHLAAVADLPGELPDVIDEELSVRENGGETACERVRTRVDGGAGQ